MTSAETVPRFRSQKQLQIKLQQMYIFIDWLVFYRLASVTVQTNQNLIQLLI